MKPLVLLGVFFAASQAFGQSVDERSASQMLCTPFVSHARNLLQVLDSAAERVSSTASDETLRRIANATVGCAESAIRLWSHPKADMELAAVERRFESGTASTMEVRVARVDVEKASYCEAAFSNVAWLAEIYDRRKQAGLVSDEDVAPMLKILEGLVPVCGWSA
jgi:hypothetical protein